MNGVERVVDRNGGKRLEYNTCRTGRTTNAAIVGAAGHVAIVAGHIGCLTRHCMMRLHQLLLISSAHLHTINRPGGRHCAERQ